MCGRFTLTADAAELKAAFPWLKIAKESDMVRRYNIAPSQLVAVVPNDGQKTLAYFRWGLSPRWARDRNSGKILINARAETLSEKPTFRAAYCRRRCLVLADGFYEWQKKGSEKQAWYFHRPDQQPFAFAGLWESWQGPGQHQALLSGTILTTTPNELSRPIHDRMPVILAREDHQAWLDPGNQDQDSLRALLVPCPDDQLTCRPVSSHVNNPRHDDEQCIRETATEQELF